MMLGEGETTDIELVSVGWNPIFRRELNVAEFPAEMLMKKKRSNTKKRKRYRRRKLVLPQGKQVTDEENRTICASASDKRRVSSSRWHHRRRRLFLKQDDVPCQSGRYESVAINGPREIRCANEFSRSS